MAYIGNKAAETFHTTKQSFTPDGSTTSFTLNHSVVGENEIELFINNVRQEPGSGKKLHTAAGTTLTMSEALPTGDDMYCIFQGKAQGSSFCQTLATIQGSHIHTTFDLTGKTVTLYWHIISFNY